MLIKKEFSYDRLTAQQAFRIMRSFLNSYYQNWLEQLRLNAIDETLVVNDVYTLLGELDSYASGRASDAKVWQDWLRALKHVSSSYQEGQGISILQTYYAMKIFLENYCEENVADDVAVLLGQIHILDVWMGSVYFILNSDSNI